MQNINCIPYLMDNYKQLEKLGGGVFGEVFKVSQISTGRIYALKKFRKGTDSSMYLNEVL